MTLSMTQEPLGDEDILNFVNGARDRNERGHHSWGDLIVLAMWDQLATLRARLEEAERREAARVAVGDRMHDFLCRLFGSPDFLADAFSKECWGLMQDWTAPPALKEPKP